MKEQSSLSETQIRDAILLVSTMTTEQIIEAIRPDNLKGVKIEGSRGGLLSQIQKWNCWVNVTKEPQGYNGRTITRTDGTVEVKTYLYLTPLIKIVETCQELYGDTYLGIVFMEALD